MKKGTIQPISKEAFAPYGEYYNLQEEQNIQKELFLKYKTKEYIVGNNVGDKDSVTDRNVLQEALRDAENREYDILVSDKDDQLGRRMLEIPMNIMSLKQFGVDVYTVKDGLLTPDLEDVMGMLKLAMQYGMAEKTV
mgnify:CR=1 FL=1